MPDLAQLTVARRYASALVAIASERGALEAVGEDMAALKRVVESDPGILRKLADPRARGAEKRGLVEGTLSAGRHALVKNLLGVLVRRRREGLLADVFFAFGEELEKALGVLRVEVETAREADQPLLADLGAKIGAATGKTVAVAARVRPELLGGVRFVVGSKLYDASVASRLDRLKKKLLTARD